MIVSAADEAGCIALKVMSVICSIGTISIYSCGIVDGPASGVIGAYFGGLGGFYALLVGLDMFWPFWELRVTHHYSQSLSNDFLNLACG